MRCLRVPSESAASRKMDLSPSAPWTWLGACGVTCEERVGSMFPARAPAWFAEATRGKMDQTPNRSVARFDLVGRIHSQREPLGHEGLSSNDGLMDRGLSPGVPV